MEQCEIHRSLLDQRLYNECHWYIAPKLLGGQNGQAVVGGLSPQSMSAAHRLEFTNVEWIGPDLKLIAKPREEI